MGWARAVGVLLVAFDQAPGLLRRPYNVPTKPQACQGEATFGLVVRLKAEKRKEKVRWPNINSRGPTKETYRF
jgi:hypothetical protein